MNNSEGNPGANAIPPGSGTTSPGAGGRRGGNVWGNPGWSDSSCVATAQGRQRHLRVVDWSQDNALATRVAVRQQ